MRLGISSYTFGWAVGVPGYPPAQPLDEQGLLDAAQALNARLVQFGDNLPLHAIGEARLDALAARARRESIELEVGARGLTASHLGTYLDLAHRLDAPLLRFVLDDGDYEPTAADVIALLRDALPEMRGVVLAIENHDRFGVRALAAIMEAVASPQVGICLDTANSFGAGEGLAEVVAILAPYTLNLHIKDFTIRRVAHKMGFTITGCPAGCGLARVPWVVAQLQQHGRCRSAILELWTPPEATLTATIAKEAAWARASLNYLRGLNLES